MTYTAPADTRVGHIHLKVSDLDRSVAFYRDVLGFEVKIRHGDRVAFLAAGRYHHHIGLNTWHSKGAPPVSERGTGMYHVAFVYPSRAALGEAVANVVASGVEIDGAADHGVSEAVYFSDPDGNGIELYWDRAPDLWEDPEASLQSKPLNLAELMAEAA